MTEHIQITTLDNGLKVATDFMPESNSVSLGIYVNTGTRDETIPEKGISHLLEHMAFKGTETRSAKDIAISMDEVGGHMNAYTTRETTAYYTKVLPKDVPLSVDILSDILQFSTFTEEDILKEKSVVIQEIGQTLDTPDDYVFDLFQETAFPNQPMGWSILGSVDSVNALTRHDITHYMKNHYAADNMIVTAAGNINHDVFLDQIQNRFKNLKSFPRPISEKANYKGGYHLLKKDHEQSHLLFGFQGIQADADEFYTLALYSTILGGGMSSRLFQTIREKHGLVYSIYSFSSTYSDIGVFGIYAGTGPKDVKKLMPLLSEELFLSTQNIQDIELERAKNQLKASLIMSRESTNARSEQLAQNLLVMKRHISMEEIIAEVDKVTIQDIMKLAKNILSTPLTFTALGAIEHVEDYDKIQERLKF
ncbi:MAG: pitrilysin family protein [Alphaproteobacteria bacterium]|nr:pitrilysin family protein [Alphaproteobacteria bacterium]